MNCIAVRAEKCVEISSKSQYMQQLKVKCVTKQQHSRVLYLLILLKIDSNKIIHANCESYPDCNICQSNHDISVCNYLLPYCATPIAINIHQVLYHRGSLFLSVFLFAGCDIQAWTGLKQWMGEIGIKI